MLELFLPEFNKFLTSNVTVIQIGNNISLKRMHSEPLGNHDKAFSRLELWCGVSCSLQYIVQFHNGCLDASHFL